MLALTDIMLYFAKFAGKEAVLEMFNNQPTSNVPGYEELLSAANNTDNGSRIPEIKHYVFGADETSVTQRITTFSDMYLFVDFGGGGMTTDKFGRISKTIQIAVTVAVPVSSTSLNQAEILLIQDSAKRITEHIDSCLRKDVIKIEWLKNYADVNTVPFIAPTLSQSQGWTLSFTINCY